MDRDNEAWLRQVSAEGTERDHALADLRVILVRGLGHSLSGRFGVDESFLEDAVQDSLLRIMDHLPQFEGRSRFVTWAMSITIRVAMTELRRRRWRDVSLDQLAGDGSVVLDQTANGSPRPKHETERETLLADMYRIIQTELTAKQRMALLAELRGMAQDEIVRQMGSNRNALYKLTHDARLRLKKGLEAAGYEAGDIVEAIRR
jgi:RNA polymerase sigma-70 factor (ECF subfamily)